MAEEATGAEAIISDDSQLDSLREGIDDPVVLREQLRKEAEARRQLTARAKKAETEAREAKEALAQKETATREPITTNSTSLGDRDYVDLRMQGYTAQDVADIQNNGGMEALKDPNSLLSLGIQARQEQRKAEEAAAGTNLSGGEDQFREVNFALPRNPSPKDMKESLAKMEQVLPHAN